MVGDDGQKKYSVQIEHYANEQGSHKTWVTIEADGKLVVEGYDAGEAPRRAWGDDDYEYWYRIAPEWKDRLLLKLIAERFQSERQLLDWLESAKVPTEFSSWT